ncbi:aldehyde dehydrogenase conserved site [Penicillium herquei]|nr:aldehyde dehydrogenase conserved site [Penicillium herquei]
MAQRPTYILAPNFYFKPETGPIALGNIISHPLRPHRALTTIDPKTLQEKYPRIETLACHDRSIKQGTSRDVSMSIWGEFLQTVTSKISGGRGSDLESTYTMECLETKYFVSDPEMEEIQARLKVSRVRSVIDSSMIPKMKNPVYIVTGLMIAKGFSIERQSEKRHTEEFEISGSAPTPGSQVGLGTSLSSSFSRKEGDSWKSSEDIVFAYQLLKIEIKGWLKERVVYDELRHKAAYLANDDSDEVDEVDNDNDNDNDNGIGQIDMRPAEAEVLPTGNGATGFLLKELGEGKDLIKFIVSFQV